MLANWANEVGRGLGRITFKKVKPIDLSVLRQNVQPWASETASGLKPWAEEQGTPLYAGVCMPGCHPAANWYQRKSVTVPRKKFVRAGQ